MKTKLAAGFMIASLGLASAASAQVTVNPGSTVFNVPGGLEATTLAGAYSIVGSMTTNYVAANPNAFSGSLESYVISGDTNNPLGGLNFLYRVGNNHTSTDAIHRLVVNGYSNYLTDAGFLVSGSTVNGNPSVSGVAPSLVDRGIGPGDNMGFSFLEGTNPPLPGHIQPGTSGTINWSDYLIVYTDATSFGTSIASVIDGSTANTTTFAPIPEPGTYAMMLAGLGLMGFVARRRSPKNVA